MEINLTKVSLIEVNLPTVVVVQTTCMSDGSDLARKSLAQIGMIGAEVILIGIWLLWWNVCFPASVWLKGFLKVGFGLRKVGLGFIYGWFRVFLVGFRSV